MAMNALNAYSVVIRDPNGNIVKQVWQKAYSVAPKGTFFIDSSTISPIQAKELAELTKSKLPVVDQFTTCVPNSYM